MAELPQGEVTFLFTDVEGSTRLWEESPDVMMEAIRQHDQAIEGAALAHRGVPVRPRGEGDSRFVVFPAALDAVEAAADIQKRLVAIDWATPEPLRVRVSLHTGIADLQLGDYYGSSVNRAARLRGIAHGGQTLLSGSTWELVQDHLPEDVSVADMGEHRLKDLTRPERVYQLNVEGMDADFPPLESLDAVPNNLPVQLTDFVGRPEVEEIKELVSDARLLTVLAPGGAGKTRSAIQAAADLSADYPDGVFFVDLAPLSDFNQIAQATAEAVGIALVTDEDVRTQLLAHLANERQLLILDNFEHVSDGAGLITEILAAAPDVKVITTSRTRLNINGETVFMLPGLDVDWDEPDEAFRTSGVHLFIDAAKRADASFSLQIDDLEPLGRILRLVDGMPLAILLAAAWVDTLAVAEIAEEIARNADFLETEMRDVPDRHRSMRAAFDYSWSLLGEDERRMYAALSAFRGGFTRDAAEQVAGASLRGLSNLVAKSLVGSDRDTGRYAVHELLRQYAEEELWRDDTLAEKVIAGHTAFYAEAAGAASDALLVHADQKQALEMLDRDIDNIRLALRRTLAAGDADAAFSFGAALIWLYETRGWVTTGAELFADVRGAFETNTSERGQIVAALAAALEAKFLANLGHVDEALPRAQTSVATLRNHDDPLALIGALEALSEITIYAGDLEAVLDLADEAIRIADDAGLEVWSAGMKNYKAGAHFQLGDLATASRVLHEGDDVLLRIGEHFMRPWNLEMQATIALLEGRLEDALEIRHRQADLARGVGYTRVEALALQGEAGVLAAMAKFDAARAPALQSMRLFDQLGLVVDQAGVTMLLAQIIAGTGDGEQAVEILSSLIADPVSENQLPFEPVGMRETATVALAELEGTLDADAFAAARRRGAATSLELMVKQVLADG